MGNFPVRLTILSGALFLSGISALVFETLWLRLCGLVFGNSVWSAALILSSFMAGLALGGASIVFLRSGRTHPLRLYAILEVLVALSGCTIVFAIPSLGQWIRPVFQALWLHDTILDVLRLALSFLILLVPTTALGLTLPVLMADPGLERHNFGRALGFLYGWNTLGAVVGSLLGEFYLVGALGIFGTAVSAAFLNLAAATLAWMLARTCNLPLERLSTAPRLRRLKAAFLSPRVWAIFGSGAALLCLEVIWFRFLRLYVASSFAAFSIMLSTVLAGIALGGLTYGALSRSGRPKNSLLPIALLAAAIATLLSYILFPVPGSQETDYYLDKWYEITGLSVMLMFPVTFISGIIFSGLVATIEFDSGDRKISTGIATMFNAGGAAVGPLLATFVLLPNFGFQRALILTAMVYALLALFVSDRELWFVRQRSSIIMLSLIVVLAAAVVFFPYRRSEAHLLHAREPFERDGSRLIKGIEGKADTFQLLRRDLLGEPYYYRLLTNAFTMSDTRIQNQRYMRLFAYLPLTFRPETEDALLICYGCGMTADALLRAPHLRRLDVVDISSEVFELADYYTGPNYANPLRDRRVTKFVQDGRFYLQATPQKYDLITGEPPPPKVAGTVNLYTEDFFSLMNGCLKENGIATFWLPINQLKVSETKAILRAFHNVFANTSVWANADYEWIMMGIKGPGRRLSAEEIASLWTAPTAGPDLKKIDIEIPEQMAALFLMDGAEIERITFDTKPLNDFYPKRLSDLPSDLNETDGFAWNYMRASSASRRFRSASLIESNWPNFMRLNVEPLFVLREMRYLSQAKGGNKFAELDNYLRKTRFRGPVLEVLNSDELRVSIVESLNGKSSDAPVEAFPDLVAGALARRDVRGAIRLLEQERDKDFANGNDLLLLTYLYCLDGNVGSAEETAGHVVSSKKDWLVNWLWGKLQAEFGFRPPS